MAVILNGQEVIRVRINVPVRGTTYQVGDEVALPVAEATHLMGQTVKHNDTPTPAATKIAVEEVAFTLGRMTEAGKVAPDWAGHRPGSTFPLFRDVAEQMVLEGRGTIGDDKKKAA